MILSIDQGTTGTTVLIINPGGEIIGRSYSEIKQLYPHPGWVSHDADFLSFPPKMLSFCP